MNPETSFLCPSMRASSISLGSAQSSTWKSLSCTLQQKVHMWLHSLRAGVI